MPILNVAVTGEKNPALSARIAAKLSELTRVHLRKDPTVTAVAMVYLEPEHWFVGGRSLADSGKATFWLDIKVVDGSNTKDELAAYHAAVFTAMGGLLGNVDQESYVLVHEVPAAAYGYGGRTQEYRGIARQLELAA